MRRCDARRQVGKEALDLGGRAEPRIGRSDAIEILLPGLLHDQ